MMEKNTKSAKAGKQGGGIIPTSTQLSTELTADQDQKALLLTMSTNNDTCVKMAIVFSEVLFPNEESYVCCPAKMQSSLTLPLRPDKVMHECAARASYVESLAVLTGASITPRRTWRLKFSSRRSWATAAAHRSDTPLA